MIVTVTAEPNGVPPRNRIDLDTGSSAVTFTSITIRRDGEVIRAVAPVGSQVSVVYDHDAPYGVACTYTVEATTTDYAQEWAEVWTSTASWAGSGWTVASGVASASGHTAAITRNASPGKITVTSPADLQLELLDASNNVVLTAIHTNGQVTLTGTTSQTVSGSGTFDLTVGSGSAAVAGSGWSASVSMSGSPTQVRLKEASPATVATWAPTAKIRAVDSSGNVYGAIDSNTGATIVKFNASGVEQSSFTTALDLVTAMAVDSSGNVFVVGYDYSGFSYIAGPLYKYNASGTQVATWSLTDTPLAVGVDTTGNVYVATADDPANGIDTIRKYNSSGTPQTSWAVSSWQSAGVDSSGNVYTTQWSAKTVKKYGNTGTLLATWNLSDRPMAVVVDGSNNVYVQTEPTAVDELGDGSATYLRKFNASGTELHSWQILDIGAYRVTVYGNYAYATDFYAGNRKWLLTFGSVDDVTAYQSVSTAGATASDTETLNGAAMWLIHATTPSLSVKVEANDTDIPGDVWATEVTSQRFDVDPSGRQVLEIEGSSLPVVVTSGPRRIPDRTLQLIAKDFEIRDLILAALQSNDPILLRSPATWDLDMPEGWFSVGKVEVERELAPRLTQETTLTLPLTPIRTPVIETTFGVTWADVVVSGATWGDLVNNNKTWLDLITTGP